MQFCLDLCDNPSNQTTLWCFHSSNQTTLWVFCGRLDLSDDHRSSQTPLLRSSVRINSFTSAKTNKQSVVPRFEPRSLLDSLAVHSFDQVLSLPHPPPNTHMHALTHMVFKAPSQSVGVKTKVCTVKEAVSHGAGTPSKTWNWDTQEEVSHGVGTPRKKSVMELGHPGRSQS